VRPGELDVPCDGVLVDAEQACGGTRAAAVADVLEQGHGLLVGQSRLRQDRSLTFREAGLAGAAIDHPDPLALSAPATEPQVAPATNTAVTAVRVLAAEVLNGVVHGIPPSQSKPR
jgi:hypothetical protein